MGHVEEHQILRMEQHGFRRGRSCESQLLRVVDDVSEALKKKDAKKMGFSKALDKVSHSLLVHKLQQYGIPGSRLKD